MILRSFLPSRLKSSIKCAEPRVSRRKRCTSSQSDIPQLEDVFLEYDPSPLHLIHTMLDKADLKPHETFLDFGSGDGRWVVEAAKCYGSKSIGIEIVPQWANYARAQIKKEGVEDLASIWQVDGFKTDLSFADVLSVYYTKEGMAVLIPKLQQELKPGSRVISIKLPIDEWIPDFQKRMYEYKVFIYNMPPKLKQPKPL